MPAGKPCGRCDSVELLKTDESAVEVEAVYGAELKCADRIMHALAMVDIRKRDMEHNRDRGNCFQLGILGKHPAGNRIFQAEHVTDRLKLLDSQPGISGCFPTLIW